MFTSLLNFEKVDNTVSQKLLKLFQLQESVGFPHSIIHESATVIDTFTKHIGQYVGNFLSVPFSLCIYTSNFT